MTTRQRILKFIYPVFSLFRRFGKKEQQLSNQKHSNPLKPIYDFELQLSNGKKLPLSELKGKKILFVNTASDCGFTPQYDDLQKLFKQFENRLVIIGFPANDFGEQEKGTNEEIEKFCRTNYDVSFPLVNKSTVVKGSQQHPVFRWLSDRDQNGWNSRGPVWNFSKYLVNEQGILTNYFAPMVSPMSDDVVKAIEA